ncbi:MAG: TonB family protein [Bacteroidales bacterium]|nr:TonB family protein [Bacteroidales bacterium]
MNDRMKRMIMLAVLVMMPVLACAQYRSGVTYEDLDDSEVVAALKSHVRMLSSAHLEGRKAGSAGEREAAEYVGEMFREYGVDLLTPVDGEVFGIMKENGDTLTSRNVIACVEGYDKSLRDNYIVVGARLDNSGTMTMTVDGKPVERIYYGANGNASGLAMLVELARMVKTNSIMFRRSVLFVAFGASEETFAGSWYFLNRSFSQSDRIDAMINLDMLGTGYNGFYAYTSSNTDMNDVINTLSGELQPIHAEITAAEVYPSDHRAFYAKDIPSVHFTTGQYPEHNTDRDTQSIIDYETMERETEYIYNYLLALANLNEAPSFRPSGSGVKGSSYEDVVGYFDCDQRPQFLNSTDPSQFLEKWVYQYLKYPESSLQRGEQGKVMVEFIIEKDGKVSNVRVAKGVSDALDAEAVKVIAASPKWKPGKVKGNKVRTLITIPVEFRLEKKGTKGNFGIKR